MSTRPASSPSATADPGGLSRSLEDYLETIFELVRERRVARVRDIAEARGVKAASVTPALRRLATLGLIDYAEREYIGLTPAGETRARRVLARHQVLVDFFAGVLRVPAQTASEDACAMEHSLSDRGMDHLVSFLEYLRLSPEAAEVIARFGATDGLGFRAPTGPDGTARAAMPPASTGAIPLSRLRLMATATVQMVRGEGALRQRLLDLGLLPGAELQVLRAAPAAGPLWIQLRGSQLTLRRREADVVLVTPGGSSD